MTHYKIITDYIVLTKFIESLPELMPHEVYYFCLFGRHKYDKAFPNTRDSGQLARLIARDKSEFLNKLQRLETPLGSYARNGIAASQEAIAVYMAMNPRSLIKANQALLVELAKRFAAGETDFNPITLANTEIHRATDRKFIVDFDFDDVEPAEHLPQIQAALPDGSYRILKTRGGFHLLVELDKVNGLRTWHKTIAGLPKCDVRGSNTLTPIPGCTQGGFTPHFL